MARAYMDVRQLAEYLGQSERYVRRLIEERRLPFTKTSAARSAKVLFKVSDVERWLAANRVEAEAS